MRKLTFQTFLIACISILIKTVGFAQAPDWEVLPGSFTNNMTITARVFVNGTNSPLANGANNLLAAYVGDELRGVASPMVAAGMTFYPLVIYSNTVLGEKVNFKIYLHGTGSVYPAPEEVDFVKGSNIGGIPNFFAINVSLGNDFPIGLYPFPPSTTLVGRPFEGVELANYLITQDNDPVNWSVINGANLTGSVGPGNLLTVTPNNPAWTGTDSIRIIARETGTPNLFSASRFARFTIKPDYGVPEFDYMPARFLQEDMPLPGGNLNDFMDFGGPCVEFSFELMLPEGTVQMPVWLQPNSNSGTMSLVVQPDFGGTVIPGASNKLAAFVNGTLAGVASPQIVQGKPLYFLTLANVGNGEIVLKCYDADHQYLHEKATGIQFMPASSLGGADDPFIEDFAPFRINLLPDGSWTTTILDPDWSGEQKVEFFAVDCQYGDKIGSMEMVFLINQCLPTETVALVEGAPFSLEAEADVSEVTWFMDGIEVGEGPLYGAALPGVYHYEGLTLTGCPDVKSCPLTVTENPGISPSTNGSKKKGTEKLLLPEDCGQTVLASIIINDAPPVAVCKNAAIALDSEGTATLAIADVDDGSFSSYGVWDISLSQTVFDCQHWGPNQIVLTIMDETGRTDTCHATVTVNDDINPEVVCKNHTVALGESGLATIDPTDVFQSGSDNCSVVYPATVSIGSFDCTHAGGAHTVVLTADDGHGNENTCTATVTVIDTEVPVPVCPAISPTVSLDANGNGTLPANIGDGSSTDNCGVTETSPSLNFSCDDIGVKSVLLTASDGTNSVSAICFFNVVDNVPPDAKCAPQPINATPSTDGEYIINPDDLNDSSSDACGPLSFSVSPTKLFCNNTGSNIVTLTVADGNGNAANCTAEVVLADFLSINDIITTTETCTGAGDGTISILATAIAGQIGYSIDGGANFEFTGTFNSLTHGTYNIVVKVFGLKTVCEKTATATVGAGSSSQTWYKDTDGDGFTDGVTQTGCTQPTGYVSSASPGDCDDNDPTELPGQTWYEDADNDGYTNGTIQTGCERPAGFRTADELANTTDIDCNDGNPNVHPYATEICNDLDDDCDGEIDEGASGGLTYTGNLALNTQAAVDAFFPCYSIIDGNLTISGAGINNLSNLENIVEVTGNLTIQSTGLINMEGLQGLTTLGANLTIYLNSKLVSLDSLDYLTTVGGTFKTYYNFKLADCCAVHDLINGGVTGTITIFFNKVGCNSVAQVNTNCAPAPPAIGSNAGNSIATPIAIMGKGGLELYPNPARNEVDILFNRTAPTAKLRVTDVLGRVVFEMDMEQGMDRLTIDLDNGQFENGLYLVSLFEDGEMIAKQLMVQR